MARALAIVLVAAMVVPAAALADGDPASDILLATSVFYPYTPPVSAPIEKQLNTKVAAAARARFPIKVALIGSPVDLGAVPSLFGKPQTYAEFLDQEISFTSKQRLLVVMRAGYGVQGFDHAATSAAATLAKPTSGQSNDLARAAILAVGRLAAASGHPIASTAPSKGTAGGSSSPLLPALILGVVAVAIAIAMVVLRRRAALPRRAPRRRR